MVESAVTDIISPAVSTEDPYGLLSEEILTSDDLSTDLSFFESLNESLTCCLGSVYIVKCCEPSLSCCLNSIRYACSYELFNVSLDLSSSCLNSHSHTETVLSIVLEQGVAPCRSVSFFVDCVRSCCARAAPD